MKAQTITTELIDHTGHNITFWLSGEGATIKLRIHYDDKTRKNSRFTDYEYTDMYFETCEKKPNSMGTYGIRYITDLCLFAERHIQWLLDKVIREEFA